mgnify:CR=1 FL=1
MLVACSAVVGTDRWFDNAEQDLGRGPAKVVEEDLNPEAASGYTEKKVVTASRFMLASANPLATQAGYDVLRKGGSAVDAAIATQLVLTLVEPQSSGLGGGAFIMVYQAAEDTLRAYDGRDAAPAAARPDRFMRNGKPMPIREAINSGLSVGTPGLLRVMELAHQRHGKLPWAELFQPAIDLAERGFPVSPRLHALLAKNKDLPKQKAAAAYFLDNDGKPWPVGHVLKNPQLAEVLRIVARQGADAFYRGEIARDAPEKLALMIFQCIQGLSTLALENPEEYDKHYPYTAVIMRMVKP